MAEVAAAVAVAEVVIPGWVAWRAWQVWPRLWARAVAVEAALPLRPRSALALLLVFRPDLLLAFRLDLRD